MYSSKYISQSDYLYLVPESR